MTDFCVLAETNFLIDVLLKQDKNAEHIMDLVESELIVLFLPEITFSEIYAALSQKHTKRLQHATESRQIANDLIRTPDHLILAESLKAILDKINELIYGAKLLGAGGGGFFFIVTKGISKTRKVKQILTDEPPNDRTRFFDFDVDGEGLKVSVL